MIRTHALTRLQETSALPRKEWEKIDPGLQIKLDKAVNDALAFNKAVVSKLKKGFERELDRSYLEEDALDYLEEVLKPSDVQKGVLVNANPTKLYQQMIINKRFALMILNQIFP